MSQEQGKPPWRARLRCWWSGHVWISDWPVSLDGQFAILAGLWMPPATCRCCGKHYDGVNAQWAGENGYLTDEPGEHSYCRIQPF